MRRPPLVERAIAAAEAVGFDGSCSDESGAVRHLLGAGRGVHRVAEIGTGVGVGTAWLVSALAPGVVVHTVELDPTHATVAAQLFAEDDDVNVHVGDWHDQLQPHAPFDLVFVDAIDVKDSVDRVLGLTAPRATLVLDGFTADFPGPDSRRDAWFEHPRLVAATITTKHPSQLVIAVVRG
ncbi:MAG: class I SAM-dependent methyltransferase [Gaiellales bacterium]